MFRVIPKLTLASCLLIFACSDGWARQFKVLHTFHGGKHDGALPEGQLTRDSSGNLDGTTALGGNGKGLCITVFTGCGTVFKLDKSGKLVWLHSFNAGDGIAPETGVLRDKEGSLYGTTILGGNKNCEQYGCGTVFKLDSTGKETVLHKFHGGADGDASESLLVGHLIWGHGAT